MNKYWQRFFWNVTHLFDLKTPNPFVLNGEDGLEPVARPAWKDLGHSIKNLWAHTDGK